jgi:hypothetical protein
MKNIIKLSLATAMTISTASASIELAAGWQMIGTGLPIEIESHDKLDNQEFVQLIWQYDNIANKWSAYSPKASIKKKIKQSSDIDLLTRLDPNKSAWIKVQDGQKFTLQTFQKDYQTIKGKSSWQMQYSQQSQSTSQILDNGDIKSIFVYRGGQWRYNYTFDMQTKGDLTRLNAFEGFWVNYGDIGIQEDKYLTSNYKSYIPDNMPTYIKNPANQKLTISSNGNSYVVLLNHDGTSTTNIKDMEDSKWKIKPSDDGIKYILKNKTNTKIAIIKISPDWSNYNYYNPDYKVDYLITKDIEQFSNKMINYSNKTVLINSNTNPSFTFEDIVLEKTLSNKFNTNINILENSTNANLKSNIDKVKSALSNSSDNDEKMLHAILAITDILDNEALQSLVEFDSSLSNVSTFSWSHFETILSQNPNTNIDNLIDTVQNITNLDSSLNSILSSLSTALQTASNELGDVVENSNEFYYFKYQDIEFNQVDIKHLQAFVYLLSSVLDNLSAYSYGNDQWLATQTKELDISNSAISLPPAVGKAPNVTENKASFEYIKAEIDPVGFINSKVFLSNVDQSKLDNAKANLIKSLTLYKSLIKTNAVGIVSDQNEFEHNDKLYINNILDNLNGKNDTATFPSVNIHYDYNTSTLVEDWEIHKLDLNQLYVDGGLFNSSDLPTVKYTTTYDEDKSIKAMEPVDINGNYIEMAIVDEAKFQSEIDAKILKVYKEIIDVNNNKHYTSTELIDFLDEE